MRLNDRISIIGSGDTGGFSLTHPLDCHAYLLDGGNELALIDAGCGLDIDGLVQRIIHLNYKPGNIRYLLLTHSHFDHSGGVKFLKESFNLQIVASKKTAHIIQTADKEKSGLGPAQRAGLYPGDLRFDPVNVDIILEDRDTILVGDQTIECILTPGHSADHTAYLLSGIHPVLFSGDSIFTGGKIILQNLPDVILQDYVNTIYQLSQLEVTALLPGHGMLTMNRGQRHLTAARNCLDQLGIPINPTFD